MCVRVGQVGQRKVGVGRVVRSAKGKVLRVGCLLALVQAWLWERVGVGVQAESGGRSQVRCLV